MTPTLVHIQDWPRAVFGVPNDLKPIHNLPAGSRTVVTYSIDDFARAVVKTAGKEEEWVLGTDAKGRTVLAWKQSEVVTCSRSALLFVVATSLLTPFYILSLPLWSVFHVLAADYRNNRAMLDAYCNR